MVNTCRRAIQEIGILRLRTLQSKHPNRFLNLRIDSVDFNPKAYLKKEQDYLEINLSIRSGLLTDVRVHRLIGKLSIDGSQPAETFEIFNNLVIHRTGQDTSWANIVVRLSCETQNYISLKREQGQDVVVSVHLLGYRDAEVIIKLDAFTGKIRVPKL